jgi:hypothetical protein
MLLSTILYAAYALSGSLFAVGTYKLSNQFSQLKSEKESINAQLMPLTPQQLHQRHVKNRTIPTDEYLKLMTDPENRQLPIKYELLRPLLSLAGMKTGNNIDFAEFPQKIGLPPRQHIVEDDDHELDIDQLEYRRNLLELTPEQLTSSIMQRHIALQ